MPPAADEMLRLLAEHLGALGDEGGPSSGGSAGGGAGAAPGMASLVDTIMQQLLSKEVLYQPMKASLLHWGSAVRHRAGSGGFCGCSCMHACKRCLMSSNVTSIAAPSSLTLV